MTRLIRTVIDRLSRNRKYLSVFDDTYESFAHAERMATGYNLDIINSRAFDAASAVIEGRGAFERDGVLFSEAEARQPIVRALNRFAAGNKSLKVLDIGGGLGSSFWQNRNDILTTELSWTVVERPDMVAVARELPPHPVTYLDDLDAALTYEWDAVLLSSVLQYLPDPHDLLRRLNYSTCRVAVVDRTPIHDGIRDRACVQHTPAHIYQASYPAWIFSRGSLEESLPSFSVVDRFPGIEPAMRTTSGIDFRWEGFTVLRGDG